MNGYELCKNIKEDITISHIPIILLTARDDKQSQLSGYKNGADAYLTKPFEPVEKPRTYQEKVSECRLDSCPGREHVQSGGRNILTQNE